MSLQNRNCRGLGQVLRFPVLGAGEAGGMGGGFVIAPYCLSHTARELLEFFLALCHAGYRYPGLTVPWAGFMNDAGGRTDAFNLLLCFQVVQLDETHTGTRGADDDVLTGQYLLSFR